jgi:hypothetical protein
MPADFAASRVLIPVYKEVNIFRKQRSRFHILKGYLRTKHFRQQFIKWHRFPSKVTKFKKRDMGNTHDLEPKIPTKPNPVDLIIHLIG